MIIIAGPCQIESRDHCLMMAEKIRNVSISLDREIIFKASFDKANRTSGDSPRGVGIDRAIAIFKEIKERFNLRILTDVHETYQCELLHGWVDILQIPALLSRQTDLIRAASLFSSIINVKKGQWMAPEDTKHVVQKSAGAEVWLTERGTSFGYHNNIVDMRSIPIMKKYAKVIFDCTHTVQSPSSENGSSGGNRKMSEVLARAAVAAGADGIFVETHNDPDNALSDGPVMTPLDQLEGFLRRMLTLHSTMRLINRSQ